MDQFFQGRVWSFWACLDLLKLSRFNKEMNPIDFSVIQSGPKRKEDYLFDAPFLSARAGFKLLELSSCNKEMNPFNFRMIQSCLITQKSYKQRKKRKFSKLARAMRKLFTFFIFQMEGIFMSDYNSSDTHATELALWAQGMIVGAVMAVALTAFLGCLGILAA